MAHRRCQSYDFKTSSVKWSYQNVNSEHEFYEKVEKIAGWLNRPAALRTIHLLRWQKENKIKGGLLEIGVFCGKYFAILLDSGRRASDKVLGIDTFEFAPPARVFKEMQEIFNTDVSSSFNLWEKRSDHIDSTEIESAIGRCRFISIDGAHDYNSVYLDLLLAEKVLSASGIIAVDDFLNPLTIGVNQAVNTFLSQPRLVEPVGYIANKLFLSHRSRSNEYRVLFEEIFANGNDEQSINFVQRRKNGRHHIEQEFYGKRFILG